MTDLNEKEPKNNQPEQFSKERNREGIYGATQIKEYSEVIKIGGEKVQMPIEAITPASRFIDVEEGLANQKEADILSAVDLKTHETEDDLQVIKDGEEAIEKEIADWGWLLQLVNEHKNEIRSINETGTVRYDDDSAHTISFAEFVAQKNIPSTGVEKYFLTTFKNYDQFYELTKFGFNVDKMVTSWQGGEEQTGVKLNKDGRTFVFIFADLMNTKEETEKNSKENDATEINKTVQSREEDYKMAA